MPILWRYLLKSYFQVFFLCTAGFISLLFVTRAQQIAKFVALNSTFKTVLLFTLCQIPYILPVAIPIAGLISTLLLFQRLSSTHELTALRASGLGMKQISAPLLIIAFILSLMNLWVVSEFTPRSRLYSRQVLQHVITANPLLLMQKSKQLQLKDSYVDMDVTDLGRKAQDVLVVVKNQSDDRLTLMMAQQFLVEEDLLKGKGVTLISHIDTKSPDLFDHLIIENQETMSIASESFSHLMKKPGGKLGVEHLPLRDLLRVAFIDQTLEIKGIKQARFECCRRLYFPLITFIFTFMGIACGMHIGRERRKKGLFFAIGLTALTFICAIVAKSFQLVPIKSALFYFCPSLLIFLISLRLLKRISNGVEG